MREDSDDRDDVDLIAEARCLAGAGRRLCAHADSYAPGRVPVPMHWLEAGEVCRRGATRAV